MREEFRRLARRDERSLRGHRARIDGMQRTMSTAVRDAGHVHGFAGSCAVATQLGAELRSALADRRRRLGRAAASTRPLRRRPAARAAPPSPPSRASPARSTVARATWSQTISEGSSRAHWTPPTAPWRASRPRTTREGPLGPPVASWAAQQEPDGDRRQAEDGGDRRVALDDPLQRAGALEVEAVDELALVGAGVGPGGGRDRPGEDRQLAERDQRRAPPRRRAGRSRRAARRARSASTRRGRRRRRAAASRG